MLKGEYKQRPGAATKRKTWTRHGRGTQKQDTQGSGLQRIHRSRGFSQGTRRASQARVDNQLSSAGPTRVLAVGRVGRVGRGAEMAAAWVWSWHDGAGSSSDGTEK